MAVLVLDGGSQWSVSTFQMFQVMVARILSDTEVGNEWLLIWMKSAQDNQLQIYNIPILHSY